MLWSFKDSIRSESQKDKLIFLLNTEHNNNPLEIFKNGCIFILCLKVKHHIFSILNLSQCVDGVKRRLDPGFQVRAGTYQFTCVVTETITTELVTRHQAILCPPAKREKNTREIKYCPGGSQRCSTKWAPFIMIPGIL